MIKSIIIGFSIMLSTYCITSNAQVIDQVTFTNIEPRFISNEIIESRSFTVTNPGEINTLSFSGTISPLDDNAAVSSIASDFVFDLIGPELEFELVSIQFSNADSLAETQSFEGSVSFIETIEEGDTFTFNFADQFDDGSASANASIDVTFEFSDDGSGPIIPIGPFIVPELPDGIDQVIFNNIEPSSNLNNASEIRTFTVNNSGQVAGLFFSGRIISLDEEAFPSDFEVFISGPNLPTQGIRFTNENGSFQTVVFENIENIIGTITEGDEITFSFVDTFDDGFSPANAIIDIAFVFLEQGIDGPDDPVFTESNLGSFTLDEGFYDRDLIDDADHPYTTVDFEVSQDGLYSIESNFTVDGFLFLFDQPFDGNDDSNNIAFNDDSISANNTSISRIEQTSLQAGIVYTALLTTFAGQPGNTSIEGDLRIQSFEGNTASLVEENNEICFPIKSANDEIVIICF